ncbi:MAG TPA: hypothetical protein VIK95_12120 [Egibacteraceae bacterium]
MATSAAESAVRDYLVALRDPSSLRDEQKIKELHERLDAAEDELERLQLRQQIMDAETPQLSRYEEAFITHAKAWADEKGISAKAFAAEGVPLQVLRRAGFSVGRGRGPSRRGGRAGTRTRTRVTSEEVRKAIPKGTFTIKQLQQLSGASPAVVRKVVEEEIAAGRVTREGTDPDHTGPGRAPVLFKRK